MRRYLSLLLLPALTLFLFTACDSNTQVSPSEDPSTVDVAELSGEQIYKGLLFGTGQAASALPEVYGDVGPVKTPENVTKKQVTNLASRHLDMTESEIRSAYEQSAQLSPERRRELVNSLAPKLVSEVKESDSDFFTTFEQRIKSGDQQQVQRALVSMADVTVPAMADVLNVSENVVLGNEGANGPDRKYVVGAVALAVAVAAALAVAVTAVVEVHKVYSVSASKQTPKLKNEMLVDLIAERFAAPASSAR